jgi:hypothetical protein
MNVVNVFIRIKKRQSEKSKIKKVQRLISHYAIERDNMVVLKPRQGLDVGVRLGSCCPVAAKRA